MINVEAIESLIDQTTYIKSLFITENFPAFSMYDHKMGKRRTSGITIKTIYKQPEFLKWKDKLLFELKKIKRDSFIEEIINELSNFNGLGEEARFDRVESKLKTLRDHLDEYQEQHGIIQVGGSNKISEDEICEKIMRAILKLQRNHYYNVDSSENAMNDFIRDILDENYTIKDQTRQGKSENGKEAGEVDIQICDDGLPIVMIEGIKISSLERDRLTDHMNKVITNYDPNGCPYVVLIIYNTTKKFDIGCKNIFDFFDKYTYPYPRENNLLNIDTGYGELKHAKIILNRHDQKIRVHIWVVHIL